ncbi:aquaporin-10-like [Polyodon spathula]|uniref:aquaporin-10-like n=1 Tax=Polyodon spathula TaxID=7913 RepID=UPI001B7E69CB|nr:aquaporin-10-like [Polyodon spathula]
MMKLKHKLQLRNRLARECLAEFLGTFVLLLFGCAAAAQVKTTSEAKGQYLSVNLASAVGVISAVYISRGVSGAHLNPAVSLSFCMLGRFEWKRLPFYILFQIMGAFAASGTVFLQYYDAIMHYSGGNLTFTGPLETASIFATYPSEYLSLSSAFVDQVIGTATLLLCILPLDDSRNSPAPEGLQPLLVGFVVLGIGMAMSSNCGGAINPARDLGPRLFTVVAGWGPGVFTAFENWWWVPVVAPLIGGVTGASLYQVFVELHHEDPERDQPEPKARENGVARINPGDCGSYLTSKF